MVMPFRLKNTGATYRPVMIVIFHDMLHESLDDYVDDIIVKSQEVGQYINDLRKVF